MNRAITLVAANVVASIAVSAACLAAVVPAIGFTFSNNGVPDRVQLRLDARFGPNSTSNWSNNYLRDELRGLTSAQLHSPIRRQT